MHASCTSISMHRGLSLSSIAPEVDVLDPTDQSSIPSRSRFQDSSIELFACVIVHKMGCFTVLKCKMKKKDLSIQINGILPKEQAQTILPEPKFRSHALKSAPPSFRNEVKPSEPSNKVANSRLRTLSAPSSFNEAERVAPSSIKGDEEEEFRCHIELTKERSLSPQPLPLPSPQSSSVLRTTGSFKLGNADSPLYASGPLPLPVAATLRSFSYEEVASACHNFSPDHCTSEGLSSIVYKASFCDVAFSSKKIEATITRFSPSSQVLKIL
ncbi:hypothetical protein Nepgr_011871 [Nepenthes gracilis]|uniref:Uncharacterized protein n=1 Tax=Nepenthes gracilis TaxID=150966 RepID=A0AAD3SFW1_NEPGR|nr:hypothetical protein Nepgr_011871 [Nepenthes gracilis]